MRWNRLLQVGVLLSCLAAPLYGAEEPVWPSPPSQDAEPPKAPTPDPPLGPPAVESVEFLMNTRLGDGLKEHGMRTFGWVSMGYTYASTGPGQLTVEPRENQFGNEFTLNQLALVIEKPLREDFSFGFRMEPYGGSDAALLQAPGSVRVDPNARWGFDFRQLYVSAHLPVLTENGVDVKVGRQYTVIGYESAMAPYRPFYSNSYEWFYSQDGANTGILVNWHVTRQLDLISAITQGANTFFSNRSDGPTYIGQVNYWLQPEKKTLLSSTVMVGNQAILGAVSGDLATVLQLRLQQNWNRHLDQIVQSDMGWDRNTPGIGLSEWYSIYNIFSFHLHEKLDVNLRGEWFNDVQGSRTGFATSYEEVTLGLDYHPHKWVRFRPEVRGDFSNRVPVFGGGTDKAQLTLALECLLQF